MKAYILILIALMTWFGITAYIPTEAFNTGPMLPLMDAKYNLREIVKNTILLEDHLFQANKRCHDCIVKHFLTIEALAEEMITLDKHFTCKEFYNLPHAIREIERQYINKIDPCVIGQQLRKMRKGMMQQCFDCF